MLLLLHAGCDSNQFAVASASRGGGASAGTTTPPGDDGGGSGNVGPNLFGGYDGCSSAWQAESHAKLTDDPMAHSGSKSCRVCVPPGGFFSTSFIVEMKNVELSNPLRLAASFFVRATNDRPAPPTAIIASLNTSPGTFGGDDPYPRSSIIVTNEWQELHVTLSGKSVGDPSDTTVTLDVFVPGKRTPPDAGADAEADAGADADAVDAGDAGQEMNDPCILVDDLLLVQSQ